LEDTISVKGATKILNVSGSRVYQLIKEKRIELIDGKPTLKSVKKYKRERKPRGRPVGSYKPY